MDDDTHDNVIEFRKPKAEFTTAMDVLSLAMYEDLIHAVVLGVDKTGRIFMDTSFHDMENVIGLMKKIVDDIEKFE